MRQTRLWSPFCSLLALVGCGPSPDQKERNSAPAGGAEEIRQRVYELYRSGDFVQAEPLARHWLDIAENISDRDQSETALALNALGLILKAQDKYAEAEPLYQRAIEIRESSLGPDHRETANVRNNLAMLYLDQGRLEDAEPLCKRAIECDTRALGWDHAETVLSRNILARLCFDLGRFQEAVALYEVSLAAQEKAFGSAHPELWQSLNNVGEAYSRWGINTYQDVDARTARLEKAKTLHLRCLAICEKNESTGPEQICTSLNNLAIVFAFQRSWDDAEKLIERAVAISRQSHAEGSNDYLFFLEALRRDRRALEAVGNADPRVLGSLTVQQAQALAQYSQILQLSGLSDISEDVAVALAQHKGTVLDLGGLVELPVQIARALANHERSLMLDGLGTLSDDAAGAIAAHRGAMLSFKGLTTISPRTAALLAGYQGLVLGLGVTRLSLEEAKALNNFKGRLMLLGLADVSMEVGSLLRSNPQNMLPDSVEPPKNDE